jgi:hypothetical protein
MGNTTLRASADPLCGKPISGGAGNAKLRRAWEAPMADGLTYDQAWAKAKLERTDIFTHMQK